ncbi:hypothetical protein RJ639_032822 [Escallonia herrerae]|uniref:Ubiquitin thioesterase OTU n=1 Tax=Escallonia herrerae TaxID=1293975 RepID=A0AA88WY67_9ASTE|nr:hypothetical protein RJ639_032822 [Escallonia herrerae]
MIVSFPITAHVKNVVRLSWCVQRQVSDQICYVVSHVPSSLSCFFVSAEYIKPKTNSCSSVTSLQTFGRSCFGSSTSKQISSLHSLTLNTKRPLKKCLDISTGSKYWNLRLVVPERGMVPRVKCKVGPVSWIQRYISAGLVFGLLVGHSTSQPVHAEATHAKSNKEVASNSSSVSFSHGKKVHTDYTVIGIPGDGRCLFRSVAHGACLRSGKPVPNEGFQREIADELRAKVRSASPSLRILSYNIFLNFQVADEFVKRREETEWFIEGDFDTYVANIRKPHVWGGEPELLMASHVLQMPITVYMYDQDAGGLISIAEYGQEYNKENPIKILYHGSGHYDSLQIPGKRGARSKL